jgi:hypothetical protein
LSLSFRLRKRLLARPRLIWNSDLVQNLRIFLWFWLENFAFGLGGSAEAFFALPNRMSIADLDENLEDLSLVLSPNIGFYALWCSGALWLL